MARPINHDIASRFWPRVNKSGPDECWEWTGTLSHRYGVIRIGGRRGRNVGAHRIAYALTNGPVGKGLHVLHHCDNPPCCNPAHLYMGTQADNVNDMIARKRYRGVPPPPNRRARGQAVSRAKLMESQVMEVRRLAGTHTRRHLGRLFGVSHHCINQIVNRITWRHLR